MVIDDLVVKHYHELSENDYHIWNYISANREEVANLPINVVAERVNVSRTTLMRFSQKLGLRGYSELKAHLRWENIAPRKSYESITEKVINNNINIINRYKEIDFDEMVRAIYEAHNIFIYGTGSLQREVAIELRRMFLSVNMIAIDLPGEGELMKSTNLLGKNDIIFIISKSGESAFVDNQLNKFKAKGVKIISLTKSGHNRIAVKSDFNLFTNIEKFELGPDTVFETMVHMFLIIEILFARFIDYYFTHDD